MLRTALHIILVVMFIGCARVDDEHDIYGELPTATTTISNLRADIVGPGGVMFGDNIVVRGNVVSSDLEENFYNSLIIDDGTGALELKVGSWGIATSYPEGLEVALRLDGLYADYEQGILMVGYKPESYSFHVVEEISSPQVVDRVVMRGRSIKRVIPRITPIRELRRSDCGRLHYFEGLTLVASTSIDTLKGESLNEARWQGYALFRCGVSDSIAVYTSSYAAFAEEHIPTTPISVVGVLLWDKYNDGEECYQLMMRYASDYHSN